MTLPYNPDHYAFRRDSRGLGDLRPRRERHRRNLRRSVLAIILAAAVASAVALGGSSLSAWIASKAADDRIERALPCALPDANHELILRRGPAGTIECAGYRWTPRGTL